MNVIDFLTKKFSNNHSLILKPYSRILNRLAVNIVEFCFTAMHFSVFGKLGEWFREIKYAYALNSLSTALISILHIILQNWLIIKDKRYSEFILL